MNDLRAAVIGIVSALIFLFGIGALASYNAHKVVNEVQHERGIS